jgi:hypothetical protein
VKVKSLLAESTVSFVLVEADGGSPKAAAAFGRVAKRMQALVPFASVPASVRQPGCPVRARWPLACVTAARAPRRSL